jgi:hypothetical protein
MRGFLSSLLIRMTFYLLLLLEITLPMQLGSLRSNKDIGGMFWYVECLYLFDKPWENRALETCLYNCAQDFDSTGNTAMLSS